jgi:hypothetical protein
MSIMNDTDYCDTHKTSEYIHYTWRTNTYQCDACWDNSIEVMFDMPRQYGTPKDKS